MIHRIVTPQCPVCLKIYITKKNSNDTIQDNFCCIKCEKEFKTTHRRKKLNKIILTINEK